MRDEWSQAQAATVTTMAKKTCGSFHARDTTVSTSASKAVSELGSALI
jgi:hypothetical protein